jgi:enoyl-CoA hydratase
MTQATQNYSTLQLDRISRVLRITLNRPERRNAISMQLLDELAEAVTKAAYDKEIHAILLRGAGPSFCAGFDIGPKAAGDLPAKYAVPKTVEEDVAFCVDIGDQFRKLWHSRVPIIAQVHGYCVAGGTDLAMHCDLIVVADDAKIGFPPVRSQGGPPTHMWIYHVGPQWAKRLLLTGDTISGTKAAEIGFALESVPAAQLEEYALALATRVSHIGRELLAHNKRVVNLGVELMGRGTMQILGAIHDVLGHNAPEAAEFTKKSRTEGLKAALAERDAPFR